MSDNPPTTDAGTDLAFLINSWRDDLLAIDLNEATTGHRLFVRQRLREYATALAAIPDIEIEAACVARPGSTSTEARNVLAFAAGRGPMADDAA